MVRGRSRSVEPASLSRRHKPDYGLLLIASLLTVFGLIVVYSISPGLANSQGISQSYFVVKQLIAIGLGIVAFLVAATVPLKVIARFIKPLIYLTALGCLIVMVTPINAAYPAHRWIRLGGFSFQIAELIKLTLLLWAAGFLALRARRGEIANPKLTVWPLMTLLVIIGLIVAKFQSDLGSAGVIAVMIGLMVYGAGAPLKRVGTVVLVVVALAGLAIAISPYRRDRLTTFLHPESNCLTSGYQECQALISVGSGGTFGLGLGNSVQAYGYLPEASNDSIFAIIGEKFGFIGTALVIGVYGVLFSRLKNIAERSADMFNRLIVVGVLAWLSTQTLINVGAMIGLLPLKGITLPFISQGGTSIVFLTTALGLVFQVSRYTSYSKVEPQVSENEVNTNNSFDGRRLGRPYNSSLTTRPRT